MGGNSQLGLALVMAVVLMLGVVQGQLIPQVLNGLTTTGRICCTPTGSCVNGSTPLSGVVVNLTCSSPLGTITVAQNTTGPNGVYNLSVSNLAGTIGNILTTGTLPCVFVINLPLNETICPVLSTTQGVLVGIPTLLNTVTSLLSGIIGNLAVQALIRINL